MVLAQSGEKEKPLTCDADKMDYDRENRILRGIGNVKVVYKDVVLYADKITIEMDTKDAFAEGNVRVHQEGKVLEAEKMHYNFETRKGDIEETSGFVYPWYWEGDEVIRHSPDFYEARNCTITTCEYENPHWRVKAKKVRIYPGDRLVANHVVMYAGNVPIFYLPVYYQSLKDERSRWTIIPGHSDKWGTYLLTGYDWLLTEYVDSTLRIDYRRKRGFGAGLDVNYRIKRKTGEQCGSGIVKTYYTEDDEYQPEGEEPREKSRYRAELEHLQFLSPSTKVRAEVHKLSDRDILRDFFRGEYDYDAQR